MSIRIAVSFSSDLAPSTVSADTYADLVPLLWRARDLRAYGYPPQHSMSSSQDAVPYGRDSADLRDTVSRTRHSAGHSRSPVRRRDHEIHADVTFSDGSAPLSLRANSFRYLVLLLWEGLHSHDPAFLGDLAGRTREIRRRARHSPSPDGRCRRSGRQGDFATKRRSGSTSEERWSRRNRSWSRNGDWIDHPQGERDFFNCEGDQHELSSSGELANTDSTSIHESTSSGEEP